MPGSLPPPTKIRVLLADDHRILREGLMALMSREPDLDLVATAEDGPSMLRQVRAHVPDVLVTDISMPGLNGIDAVQRLRAELPQVQVLCLSVHDEDRLVLAMIEAGASGYVLKDGSFEELALAVRQVVLGRIYISPVLSGVMVREVRRRSPGQPVAKSPTLTARERQLVQLFSEGYTTNEIAEQLHVSPKTVATHRENVLHKLQLRGVAELTRYALREGLSSLDATPRPGLRR
ncbi:MAG: response regulator transcription factor [Burkholderiaceae bacterium]|nr:response regulator transcription factor [Burkholderiaceae bacterium]